MSEETIVIYTDGACRGNPGPGGWGAIISGYGKVRELRGGENPSTNNRMELTAAIEALATLTRPCKVRLTTDSQYVRKGITEWMVGWKRKNWLNSQKKPVANKDLWQKLDAEASRHEIEWKWVKGHSGHPQNERADELANLGIDELI